MGSYLFVLDEGRNREIRRVLARVGHKVQRLTRIAVGPVRLGDLPLGAYRPLTVEEIKSLRKAPDAKREDKEKKSTPQQGYRASSSRPKKGQGQKNRSKAGPRSTTTSRTTSRTTSATSHKPAGRVILGLDGTGTESAKSTKQPSARKPRKRST